jgi:hypothetical protein
MNRELKYQLDKSPRKFICPDCNQKRFVRFVDMVTGEYLSEKYGRCDREINCGYFNNPYNDLSEIEKKESLIQSVEVKPSFIGYATMKKSLQQYDANHFIQFLLQSFDSETVNRLIERYYIGTSKHWPGSTIFWQIDSIGKIRAGKIMLYNAATGKRIKEPDNCITWVHKAAKLTDFNLKQCLFGEHLLSTDSGKTVAIVESEKTAIISSMYFPNYTWLAAGQLNGLSFVKFKPLAGRNVILFPDANGFEKWTSKAKALKAEYPNTSIKVSDILEINVSDEEKKEGFDIADYLLQFPVSDFHAAKKRIAEVEMPLQTIGEIFDMLKTRYKHMPSHIQIYANNWPIKNQYQSIKINKKCTQKSDFTTNRKEPFIQFQSQVGEPTKAKFKTMFKIWFKNGRK